MSTETDDGGPAFPGLSGSPRGDEMTDWTKWRMVPVEPTPEMCKAVSDYGSTRYIYGEMLAAAPPPPVVEVTDEVADTISRRIMDSYDYADTIDHGRAMIAAVQQVLGPHLGLVTREEAQSEIAELRNRLSVAIDALATVEESRCEELARAVEAPRQQG